MIFDSVQRQLNLADWRRWVVAGYPVCWRNTFTQPITEDSRLDIVIIVLLGNSVRIRNRFYISFYPHGKGDLSILLVIMIITGKKQDIDQNSLWLTDQLKFSS